MPEVMWMLAAVVLILYLSYRCSRYIAQRGGIGFVPGAPQTAGGIRLVSRLALAQDKQLVVVETGERYWLLGVSSAGIQLVTELSAADAEACRAEQKDLPSFRDVLQTMKSGNKHE